MRVVFCVLTLVIGLGLATTPALATDFEFNKTTGIWDDESNWDPSGGPPGPGDTATIPSAKTCRVTTDEECDSFTLGGTLKVEAGHSLTVSEDCNLGGGGGKIQLVGDGSYTADLIIAASLTMSGKAATIEMWNGLITYGQSSDPTLTFERTSGPGPSPPVIHGDGEIKVKLTNKAWVWADHDGETLYLTDKDKSGVVGELDYGDWEARNGGILQVDAKVTGDATWGLLSGALSQIVINQCLTDLTGEVHLHIGTLTVNQSFCTTGNITWRDATTILVEEGVHHAIFGITCPATLCP